MSQRYYTQHKWRTQQLHLARLLRVERPTRPAPHDRDVESAFANVSVRYVKYVQIYQRIMTCYDHIVHPQKRILIGQCLEGICGRLIELRGELVRLDLNPYSYLGAACHDLKVSPDCLEMTLSKSLTLERVASVRKRTQALDYILATMNKPANKDNRGDEDVYTIEEAVLLIQKNERCYQGRIRHKLMAKKKKRSTKKGKKTNIPLENINLKGVLKFQSMWRGHCARKRIAGLRKELDQSLNMVEAPRNGRLELAEEVLKTTRHKEACVNDDNYRSELIIQTEKMSEVWGPAMAETMKAEILQWILECRNITEKFPDFPSVEEGGSAVIFKSMSLDDLEDQMDELQEQLKLEKQAALGKKDAKKTKGKEKPEEKEKDKKKAKDDDDGLVRKPKQKIIPQFVLKDSAFVEPGLVQCARDYDSYWYMKDEADNPKQTHDVNLLMENVEKKVETIVRLEVDELMRQELDRLTMAVDKQRNPKPKPKKEKKEKKKRGRGKKKKMPDLTPGVPIEELHQQLVLDGIIKKVDNVLLRDYIGSYNLISPTDHENIECLPDLGDIRRMIFIYAILPMASSAVHEMVPLLKSMLLVGPESSGKKMLVNAICSELGATFFDMSPQNLVGKYEDPKGQKILMNTVMKVAKEMEPAVIFLEHCDTMFTPAKKLTPEQAEMNPGRMKKELNKALKFITQETRIMLIGTSKYPFLAKMGPWMKMFDRLLFIYPPTHSSRYLLWEKLITDCKGEMNDHFSLSALAKVSQGYSAGYIKSSVEEVLTEKRRNKMHIYPLTCKEFVTRLALCDPVFHEELDMFRQWLGKTPLAKKKALLQEIKDEGKEFLHLM